MHNTPAYDPPFELPTKEYYQLIHTLTALLPPPLADTPEALRTRNQAALDQVAALLPTNSNEAGLAAQCIATRAQATDVLRQIREHAEDDIRIVIKLNAQYVAMVRTSLGAYGHLLRAQAIRHKREQNNIALSADQWTQHIAASAMQQALDAGPPPAAAPASVPPAIAPAAAPVIALSLHTPAAESEASAPHPSIAPPAGPTIAPAAAPSPRPPAAEPAAPPHLPSLAASPPPAAAAEPSPAPTARPLPPPIPAMLSAAPPPAPVPVAAPPRPQRQHTAAPVDEPPRDMAAEAERYAAVYPHRARAIRQYGGLPPDCTFGPPDDDLVRAIVTGTSPALHALDGPAAALA